MPPEIRGWNWGAFLLSWIWGIGNNIFIALLFFVPMIGFVMPFVLGAKGNEWAWKKNKWQSVEHFKKVQRNWAIAGLSAIGAVIMLVFAAIFIAMAAMKSSDVYKNALSTVQNSAKAVQILGEPIEGGFFVSGSISVEGPSGKASISFPVKGPKGEGTVYVEAAKYLGKWNFSALVLQPKGKSEQIALP